MVLQVGAFEAKTQLSKLIGRVRRGDRVIITHRGKPVAVLVSPEEIERGHVAEVIRKLSELRARTRGSGSLQALRAEGRRY